MESSEAPQKNEDKHEVCAQCYSRVYWPLNASNKGYQLIVGDDNDHRWIFCGQFCLLDYLNENNVSNYSDNDLVSDDEYSYYEETEEEESEEEEGSEEEAESEVKEPEKSLSNSN